MISDEELKTEAESFIEEIKKALEEWQKDPENELKRQKVEQLSVYWNCQD